MVYEPDELEKIKKIQNHQNKKKNSNSMNVKLIKSGLSFEINISKIKKNQVGVSIFDCQKGKSDSFEIPLSNIPNLSENEKQKSIMDHILENLQLENKQLVYRVNQNAILDQQKSTFIANISTFLVNYEKEYEISFNFNSKENSISASLFENKDKPLIFSLTRKNSGISQLEEICRTIAQELAILFKEGLATIYAINAISSKSSDWTLTNNQNSYEILIEKNVTGTLVSDMMIIARLIRIDSNIYLMNINKKAKSRNTIQEVVLIGKNEQKDIFTENLNKASCKKLLYEQIFYGVDENDLLQNPGFSFLENQNNDLQNFSNDDQEMNEAAKKIQAHYKKKIGKRNANKNGKAQDVSLRSIKEVNETKMSNDDSIYKKEIAFKGEDSVNDMVFDKEMDVAAAKIQKHYRNKKSKEPKKEEKLPKINNSKN